MLKNSLSVTLIKVFSLIACALLTGCSDSPELAEVSGMVLMDGKPLQNVEIVFSPEAGQSTADENIVAACSTDAEGRFSVGSSDGETGVLPGAHRVIIRDLAALPAANLDPMQESVDAKPAKKTRVSRQFQDLQQTPLRDVKITSGRQEILLELNSRKKSGTVKQIDQPSQVTG